MYKNFSKGQKRREHISGGRRSANHRFVAGLHASLELLKTQPQWVCKAYLARQKEDPLYRKILKHLHQHDILIEKKTQSYLEVFCGSHQGVVLEATDRKQFQWSRLEQVEKAAVIILDSVEDSHNLGAIIRTSWLLGVEGVFVSNHQGLKNLTPAVHKVSCGGVEHVPIEFHHHLPTILKKLKNMGFWIYGLDHTSQERLWDVQYSDKTAWLLGSESKGLRKSIQKMADVTVKIPQKDAQASYNVSVATGLAVGEWSRQLNL